MDATKGSSDVRQELLNCLLKGKKRPQGCNGYLPHTEKSNKKITTITGASFLYSGHNPRPDKVINQQYNKTVNNIIMINA